MDTELLRLQNLNETLEASNRKLINDVDHVWDLYYDAKDKQIFLLQICIFLALFCLLLLLKLFHLIT